LVDGSQQEQAQNIASCVRSAALDGDNLRLRSSRQVPARVDRQLQVGVQRAMSCAHSRPHPVCVSVPVPLGEVAGDGSCMDAVNGLRVSVGCLEARVGENDDAPPAGPRHAMHGSEDAVHVVDIHQPHDARGAIEAFVREPREGAGVVVNVGD
jgi:hypothetical protein